MGLVKYSLHCPGFPPWRGSGCGPGILSFCETNPIVGVCPLPYGRGSVREGWANLRNEPNGLIPGDQAASWTGCNGVRPGGLAFCETNPMEAAA